MLIFLKYALLQFPPFDKILRSHPGYQWQTNETYRKASNATRTFTKEQFNSSALWSWNSTSTGSNWYAAAIRNSRMVIQPFCWLSRKVLISLFLLMYSCGQVLYELVKKFSPPPLKKIFFQQQWSPELQCCLFFFNFY